MVDYNTFYKADKGLSGGGVYPYGLFIRLDKTETGYNYICVKTATSKYGVGMICDLLDSDVVEYLATAKCYYKTEFETKRNFAYIINEHFKQKKKAEIINNIKAHNRTDYYLMEKTDILRDRVKFLEETLVDLIELI